ncbi:hypothetical protein B0H16DRAFT_1898453 [Mycena metata]|uniref:Uncharacterized protein n=1 Tax=Mycena metata TaxID=1033252 RepID=A0AAD7HBB4_9AGAR|nr:hypothetical protein B0H16DRAFT_1898453 [Mycena metata]
MPEIETIQVHLPSSVLRATSPSKPSPPQFIRTPSTDLLRQRARARGEPRGARACDSKDAVCVQRGGAADEHHHHYYFVFFQCNNNNTNTNTNNTTAAANGPNGATGTSTFTFTTNANRATTGNARTANGKRKRTHL